VQDRLNVETPALDLAVAFGMGYFYFDTVKLILFPKVFSSPEVILHHLVGFIGFPLSFVRQLRG
jgi:hypothetical protein